MFITLYGINNIGKSTHALRLVERLKVEGYEAVYVKYPVYDVAPSGGYLNECLRSGEPQKISEEELQIWFALNRFQFEPTLKTWLSEGKVVVAEDYSGTGIAWGMAKGLKRKWLETINAPLLQEDLALLLDGEPFPHAREEGHLHENNPDFMQGCRQIHLELGERYGWMKIPVQPTKEETEKLIWEVVRTRIALS